MNYIGDRLGFDIEFVDMTFVKKGGKDNVFSRLYEILKGFGEECVTVGKIIY